MFRNLEVAPAIFGRETVGYQVVGLQRACSDSLWEPVAHEAVFRTRERAERFMARVCASGRIDHTRWGVPFGASASAIDAFHHVPAYYSVL